MVHWVRTAVGLPPCKQPMRNDKNRDGGCPDSGKNSKSWLVACCQLNPAGRREGSCSQPHLMRVCLQLLAMSSPPIFRMFFFEMARLQ